MAFGHPFFYNNFVYLRNKEDFGPITMSTVTLWLAYGIIIIRKRKL